MTRIEVPRARARGEAGIGSGKHSDLLVRLSASASVTWPPNTTFLIASDGCAQRSHASSMVNQEQHASGKEDAATRGGRRRGAKKGVLLLPGRAGAAATAWRRGRGPGAAATRVGRPWRCGSSSPAPPAPSLPPAPLARLSLGVSLLSLPTKKEGGRCETREVEWSWSSGGSSRMAGRCGVPVLRILFSSETQHVPTITKFEITYRWGPIRSYKPDMRAEVEGLPMVRIYDSFNLFRGLSIHI